MATATAMAALRAMALGNCGGSTSNEHGSRNSRGKDNGDSGNSVGDDRKTIALVALAIAHFITHHVVSDTITCVVAVAIAFVSVQQREQWQGGQEQWQQ